MTPFCALISRDDPLFWPNRWYDANMARQLRNLADHAVYHVLNRGNGRMRIFQKAGDFEAFIKLLEEGRKRVGMRILGYCLMDNHWHLVLWPRRARDLPNFMAWLS